MSVNLTKKLEEQKAKQAGTMSLSQCMNKHAKEFAAAAAEKRLKATNRDAVEEFTGEGTRPDQSVEPLGENHYAKPQQMPDL